MECLNAEGAWRSLGGEREEDEENIGDRYSSDVGVRCRTGCSYNR